MKKIFITLVLLIYATLSYSEEISFYTNFMSYKILKDSVWQGWSDWRECYIEIAAEYDKRLSFFKTIKTNTIYCEKTDYPRLFYIKTINLDKLRFRGTSVTLADNAIYEKEDSFPLDFLLKCEELVGFQNTYNIMVEEIKSIEKRKESDYKLFSDIIKEKKKHNDTA